MKHLFPIAICALLLGCGGFKLGRNIELSEKDFDAPRLAEVSAKCGVTFPPGTVGLHYYYHGDTIDPYLIAKVEIPTSEKAAFMAQSTYEERKRPLSSTPSDPAWWTPGTLKNAAVSEGNGNPITAIKIGEESEKTIVYLQWLTY